MALLTEPDGRVDTAVYSRRQMADLLDVSERHIDRMVRAGQVPGLVRVGRLVKFSRVIIDAWLAGAANSPK
jgi:excisionase family DNA binding protein